MYLVISLRTMKFFAKILRQLFAYRLTVSRMLRATIRIVDLLLDSGHGIVYVRPTSVHQCSPV